MSGGLPIAEALEAEHNVLHKMWRELRGAASADDSTALLASLEKFTIFCGEHFEHEEQSLIKYRELGRKKHIASHQHLIDRLISLRIEIRENNSSSIVGLLADWWVAFRNHVYDCDRPALERLLSGSHEDPPDVRLWQPPARAEEAAKPGS